MKKAHGLPVNTQRCKSCPFRPDGWTEVRELLSQRALTEASPICHSTGKALVKSQGKARICRGARDLQIQYFYAIGFLDAPTDAAWEKKKQELGIP